MFLSPRTYCNGRVIYWILFAVVAVFVLWSLSIPAVTAGPDNTPQTHALAHICRLSGAVKDFVTDQQKKKSRQSQYPAELHQLVTDGYLSETDYSKLTKDIDISYFPPTTETPSPNHLLIVAHIPKYVIYIPISGKFELHKTP